MCKLQAPSKIVLEVLQVNIYSIWKMTKNGADNRGIFVSTSTSFPSANLRPCLHMIPPSPQRGFYFALVKVAFALANSKPLDQVPLYGFFALFFACFTFNICKTHTDEGLVYYLRIRV